MTEVAPPTDLALAPLEDKEELFALEYMANGCNGGKAYLRVNPGVSIGAARVQAHRILARPAVAARILEIRKETAQRAGITADMIVAQLKALAFTDLRDVFNWNGNTISLKSSDEISPEAAAAISEITMDETPYGMRYKIKMEPKRPALELLGQTLGMFKQIVSHEGEVTWVVTLPKKLSEDEWRAQYTKNLPAPPTGGGE